MKLYRYPVLILSSLFLFMNDGCGADNFPDSNIVARYDADHGVTIKELNKYVKDWLYYKKFKDRADVYNHALNDMITNQLKRIDFFEKGLDKNEKLIQSISRIINEELVSEYFETQYVAKYVNEEYAKKIYGIMDKEVVYQLIELSKPQNASQEQLDSLKEKASAIKSEINNGKDFSSLVKEYSQNKISLVNNGYMPPVNWRQSILDPVGGIIFRLNKDDVRVLNSDNAFIIVKIIDINKIHVEPFDSIKSKIISDLRNVYLNISFEEYEKDKKELIDENSLKWNTNALEEIVQWSIIPDFYKEGEYKKTFKNVLDKGENKIILTYNNSSLDYKELLRLLDHVLLMGDTDSLREDDIKKYILEALRTDLIVKKANSLDLKKNIFNAYTTNPSLKYQIVYLYNQAEVEAKIPEATDEALHQFFKNNEDTLYYLLEKRNLFVMVFPAEGDAEKTRAKINSGTPFEKVTGSYLVKTYIKERNGEIKSYLNDEKPTFGKIGFEMKESEVSGPVEFKDENSQVKYAVIKCYHIRPEKQLTFEDVKNTITEDFKNYHRKKIEKGIEKELRSKYHPVINEEVLAKIISPE
ncbi:MAG: peptidyl-prolyl cis-trans isomerase [Ignavibacteria bacterium]